MLIAAIIHGIICAILKEKKRLYLFHAINASVQEFKYK